MESILLASWQPWETDEALTGNVGEKVIGLVKLPPAWVPPFIVFTSRFRDLRHQLGSTAGVLELLQPDERESLSDLMATASAKNGRLLVRSNFIEESLDQRGMHQSYVIQPSIEQLIVAVDRFCASEQKTFPVLQLLIEPGYSGHLSNERRVSRRKSVWLVEGLPTRTNRLGQAHIRASQPHEVAVLRAPNPRFLVLRLREVAGWLSSLGPGYYHCEWVWDGSQLWIVQADAAPPLRHEQSANQYVTRPPSDPPSPSTGLQIFQHYLAVPRGRWRKLDRPHTFAELGFPTADIFLLSGNAWGQIVTKNPTTLLDDLHHLCTSSVVVRCDIAPSVHGEDIFLPTSQPLGDPHKVLEFMAEVAERFTARGLGAAQWAFLVAVLVPARSSAMVHTRPNSSTVRIDALWGFPDGLQCFPHDTYFYDLDTEDVRIITRYKSHAVIPQVGSWLRVPLDPPLDWSQVLTRAEITSIAQWARKLAEKLSREVQFMTLTRVNGVQGPDGCLPWHFTTWAIPPYTDSALPLVNLNRVYRVTSRAHLAELYENVPSATPFVGIRIEPEETALRDIDLLRGVALYAAEKQIPIYFEGSLLSHAYYVLSSEGAPVIPISPEHPPIIVKSYNKLVRDLIPVIIQRSGGVARVRTLPSAEAVRLLSQKLIEEAFEVWESSAHELAGELADVLEVVDALLEHAAIDRSHVAEIQRVKREQRGGFSDLVILQETANARPSPAPIRDGALPLWDAESTRLSQERTKYIKFSLQSPGDPLRLSFPLVPPVEAGMAVKRIAASNQDVEITITYEGTRVILSIQKVTMPTSEDQLSFFPES